MPDRRPRVVVLCGGLPIDPSHLVRAATEVDLIVYRSAWSPRGPVEPVDLPGIEVRSFAPVVRSTKGHLTYAYRGLSRALLRDRPDIVYAISEPWGLLAVQAALWVRRHRATKLVLHGCDTVWHHGSTAKRTVRRALLRVVLPVTSGWAAENSKAVALAAENGMPASGRTARIHTNPRNSEIFRRPTPAQRTAARDRLGLASDEAAVGMIGRLVPQKGVREYLGAADELQHSGFACRFFVAGAGPLAETVGRHDNPAVTMLGMLDHPHGVMELLQALDVIACPSLTTPTWEDQGPRAVLEAMMVGCVPVVSPTGALPEMLDGHGVVAAGVDATALAAAITEAAALARDDRQRDAISAQATDTYSGTAVGDALIALWRECLDDEGDVPALRRVRRVSA